MVIFKRCWGGLTDYPRCPLFIKKSGTYIDNVYTLCYAGFGQAGNLNHSTAINIFYHAIEKYHGLPFSVRIPNQETINAMRELESGSGDVYGSADGQAKELQLVRLGSHSTLFR